MQEKTWMGNFYSVQFNLHYKNVLYKTWDQRISQNKKINECKMLWQTTNISISVFLFQNKTSKIFMKYIDKIKSKLIHN